MGQEDAQICPCLEGDVFFQNFERREVGDDSDFGEVSVNKCKRCGRDWLEYFIEYESFSAAGRWFRGVVAPEAANSVKPSEAKATLESLEWYFRGGSAFGGRVVKTSGALKAWLL